MACGGRPPQVSQAQRTVSIPVWLET